MGLRENLWQDDISHVDLTPPLVVSPQTPVRATIERLREAGAGCILVCDGSDLVGIFTERDFVKRVLAPRADLDAPVRDFATTAPVSVRRDEVIGSVIRTMHEGHYRHLPVVDSNGRPVGTVSVKRIVQYLVDHFPSAVYNLPPRPRQAQTAREGA